MGTICIPSRRSNARYHIKDSMQHAD